MLNVPAWFRTVVYSAISFVSSIVIGFFSKKKWMDIYKSKSLPHINQPIAIVLLPIILILNITLAVIAVIEIINKGISIKNIFALVVEVAKVLQTLLALLSIAAVISISAVAVSALLVAAMSLETIFNAGLFLSHLRLYYYAATPQEQHEHKMLAKKYGVSFGISFLLVIGLALTVLASLPAPILFPIAIATALIASIGGMISVVYSLYADKKSQQPPPNLPPMAAALRSLLSNEENKEHIPVLDVRVDELDADVGGSGMSDTLTNNQLPLALNSSTIFHHSSIECPHVATKSSLKISSLYDVKK